MADERHPRPRCCLLALLAIAAMTVPPGLAAESNALVLCRRRTKLAVRTETCKKHETAVALSELGPAAPGDGSVTGAKIADGAVGAGQLAVGVRGAVARWAAVDPLGTLVRGRGAKAVVHVSTGNYRVAFDRDLSACGWVGTPSADVGLPAAFAVRTALDVSDPTRIVVRTTELAGSAANSGFNLVVVCGADAAPDAAP
jgi:hypothetical protein